MSDCKKHKIKDVNDYKHLKPDTSCTCEGAGGSERGEGMGPATDPELVAKRKQSKEGTALLCGYGGIGRRAGLKIRWLYRAGSSPVARIMPIWRNGRRIRFKPGWIRPMRVQIFLSA